MKFNFSKLDIKFSELLNGAEVYTLILLFVYSVLLFVFPSSFDNQFALLNINFGIAAIVITIAFIGNIFKGNNYAQLFRMIALAPIILLMYDNTQNYVRAINPIDYDNILISWDKMIFGGDPSEMLAFLRTPILTEILQFCYFSFFFLPVIHGIELYRRQKHAELNTLTNQIVFGFLFSYLLYLFMPAIGPRFTLYDIHAINTDIPGVYFTDMLRTIINAGGGAPDGIANPALHVNRDCMPSGHTWLTLMNIVLAFKFRSKFRWAFCIIGGGLIFSTIYMRYHYGVDVIMGVIFAILSLYLEPRIREYLRKLGFSKV